jgi:hypothetical protein
MGEELDADIAALLDDTIIELQAPVPVVRINDCFPTEVILSFLTPPSNSNDNPPFINLVAILREDIYKKTTGPLTVRSLLDLPSLTPDYFYNNYWTVTTELFFNYTPKAYLTKNSPFLKSFIDLTNETVINEIDKTGFVGVNVPDVVGLFSDIKFRQYRAGLMIGFGRQYDNWMFCGRIPLYYLLEHFFLTDDEIDKINKSPFFATDQSQTIANSPNDEVNRFALKHLVSDKFGVGDARLCLLAHLVKQECQDLWLGLQTTIPTARAFKRGLIGGEFNPDMPIPLLNLQHFFNVYFCNNEIPALNNAVIRKESIALLIDVLDRLSTILINEPLGNGKHFGLGPEVDWRYSLNDYFSMHGYASVQFFMPHRETRFFLIEKTESDFDRNWRDPLNAGENLALLNQLIIETLFPVGIRTSITPGARFQINYQLMYKSEHWDLALGFDYWRQGGEHQQPLLPIVPFNLSLVRSKAERPAAQQGKVFASVGYYGSIDRSRYDTDWYISANMDASVFNEGIGRTYTVGLRAGIEF